jgi:hypothetical protein
MSFTPAVSRHHNDLARIMRPFRGQVLTTSQIKERIEQSLDSKDAQWVQPSDHCKNHTCEGDCACAGTDSAIFEQIKRGRYRVR